MSFVNLLPRSVVEMYCDSIGISRIKNDLGQYKQILNDQFTWLRNEPSETFKFASYEALGEFLTTHPDNKDNLTFSQQRANEKTKDRITWRGNSFLGWMFYVEEV